MISNAYASVLAFFENDEQLVGTNKVIYTGELGGSIEVNIPEAATYIRVGNNTDASGAQHLGPAVYKLVV